MAKIEFTFEEVCRLFLVNVEKILEAKPIPNGIHIRVKTAALLPNVNVDVTFLRYVWNKLSFKVEAKKLVKFFARRGMPERDWLEFTGDQITVDTNMLVSGYLAGLSNRDFNVKNNTVTIDILTN